MKLAVAMFVIVGLTLVGCAGPAADPAPPIASPTETSTPEPVTAAGLAEAIKAAIPSVTAVTEITEENDPNDMIGRPNGYVGGALITDSRATECVDSGVACGATIEDWANEADAYARSDYIQDILKDSPMLGSEYNYIRDGLLLRVSGELPPSAAAEYEAAFTNG